MKIVGIFFFVFIGCFVCFSQMVELYIILILCDRLVVIGSEMVFGVDIFYFSCLQFYIFCILVDDGVNSYFFDQFVRFIDVEKDVFVIFFVFEGFCLQYLYFIFGIDSVLNCFGVFGGDLDFLCGLYWVW